MCVIIHRPKGVIVPEQNIESACIVNSDGFGLAVADRGRIELIRELDPRGNQPDRVLKLLEEAKDLDVLLHLRFVTVGKKSLENCHPFVVTTHADDGVDIVLAHNGTMSAFNISGNDFSDSYMFNEMIVRPMIERSLCSPDIEPQDVLEDEFIQLVLEEFIPSSSVVSLFDGNGKILNVHEKNGYEHGETGKGWWSSNNYSFNVTHRKGTSGTTFHGTNSYSNSNRTDYLGGQWPSSDWDYEDADQTPNTDEDPGAYDAFMCDSTNPAPGSTARGTSASLPQNTPSTYDDTDQQKSVARKEEHTKLADTFKRSRDNKSPCPSNSMLRLATSSRPGFCRAAGIDSLSQVCVLEREDISELVHFYPESATLLIQDLLRELYLHDKTIEGDKNIAAGRALVVVESTPLSEKMTGSAVMETVH